MSTFAGPLPEDSDSQPLGHRKIRATRLMGKELGILEVISSC